jgi:hypothetical protein
MNSTSYRPIKASFYKYLMQYFEGSVC